MPSAQERAVDSNPASDHSSTTHFDDVWRDDRGYLLGLATRMLGDAAEVEDVVQDAFGRLARVDLAEIDDVRGWTAVVVRRLCLDRAGWRSPRGCPGGLTDVQGVYWKRIAPAGFVEATRLDP